MIVSVIQYAGPAAWIAEVAPLLRTPLRCFADSPAREALGRRGLASEPTGAAVPALSGAGVAGLLTGTSLDAGPEKEALREAGRRGIPSASVVDNWNHYMRRFEDDRGRVYPDVILLNDEAMLAEAVAAGLPAQRLRVAGSPVLEALAEAPDPAGDRREWRRANGFDPDRPVVAFISEDLARHFPPGSPEFYGYTEGEALDGLTASLPPGAQVLVKLHPHEDADKFSDRSGPLRVVREADVGRLIAFADKVVGMGSMLLLEAAARRGDVIAFRPRQRRPFIGVQAGALKLAQDPAQLRRMLADDSSPPPSAWAAGFAGSRRRAADIIEAAFS